MITLTVRCINSFDFGTIFYMPLTVPRSATLSDLAGEVWRRAAAEAKYRPMRPHQAKYDRFKVYVLPGQPKPANLTISREGREFGPEEFGQSLEALGLQPDTELSYYSKREYDAYFAKQA